MLERLPAILVDAAFNYSPNNNHSPTAHMMLFSLTPTGARSSSSEARKLNAAQYRPVPSQRKNRLKIVANSTAGLPDDHFTENKEPKASWWDTSPLDHIRKYVETLLPPTPYRHHTAAIYVGNAITFWLVAVPFVSIIICYPAASTSTIDSF